MKVRFESLSYMFFSVNKINKNMHWQIENGHVRLSEVIVKLNILFGFGIVIIVLILYKCIGVYNKTNI